MRAILLLLAALLLPACSSLERHEIVVGLDDALTESRSRPTIQVDLVGLDDAERKWWDDMSLSTYWMPDSDLRKAFADRSVRIRFGAEATQPVRISIDHDIWNAWQRAGATWLYVVANLPGGLSDAKGTDDPRRLAISLNAADWADNAVLEIEVRRNALVFVTPRSAGAQPSR